MLYDFDKPVNRRDTHSMKWDVKEHELPMWVADMDFQTAPEIQAAIQERAAHGVFGYSVVPGEWYQAYMGWWERRHGFSMEKEWLVFCTGVVPAISSMVRKLTTPGENVLVQTPVYNIFFNSTVNNGRNIVESPLRYDESAYQMDFEDLERKLSNPQTTLMILCNPHNPVGKIWSREELGQVGELCRKYHVTVISDEIHCDLTSPGKEYIPFASVSENCRNHSITCIAPTKAFNLAGLQTAAVVVPNPNLRHKVWRGLNTDEVAEPNSFAVEAAVAAFTKGEAWLDALRVYIQENKNYVENFLKKEVPQIRMVPSQATYLLWLDCQEMQGCTTEFIQYLREYTGLYLSEGQQYGESGSPFIRMNIACPRSRLEDGMKRLAEGVRGYEEWVLASC
ncbi:pyridoxal phosphate-dependent aminotransferase [Clostridiaceae bacterium]|nr:pyridoxal phosphate-dependent aminotransferase [Clostridiaceae bacterium]RKI18034.1 pyridoxal phosphate-dependent aminotransferase [bacterium 1XD21-70]